MGVVTDVAESLQGSSRQDPRGQHTGHQTTHAEPHGCRLNTTMPPLGHLKQTVTHPRRSLMQGEKKCSVAQFSQKSPRALHVLAMGDGRLAVGGWWRLVVGVWWLMAVGSSWRLAAGRRWRLAAVDGWRLVAVGGWWLVAIGGWRLMVLGAVLNKNKIQSLKDPPCPHLLRCTTLRVLHRTRAVPNAWGHRTVPHTPPHAITRNASRTATGHAKRANDTCKVSVPLNWAKWPLPTVVSVSSHVYCTETHSAKLPWRCTLTLKSCACKNILT